jgi:hypothetical protein
LDRPEKLKLCCIEHCSFFLKPEKSEVSLSKAGLKKQTMQYFMRKKLRSGLLKREKVELKPEPHR